MNEDKKIWISLNYNPEKTEILFFNEYGPLFVLAKKDEMGRWHVDTSEIKKTVVDVIEHDLNRDLTNQLNSDEVSNERLNAILNQLRDYHNV